MGNEKFKIENGILTEYTGEDEIIEIPNTVSVIGESVFKEKTAKKLTIPNSVKIIGKDAFRYSNIDEIIMNNGVIIIGETAFYGTECKSITFSENLLEIQGGAFGNFQTEKIELAENIKKIGNGAFQFSELQVALPRNVIEIGKLIYAGTKIKEIIIPSKINIIPKYAFGRCENLERVVIENATMDLNEYYYDGYDNETVISTTKIEDEAFCGCENLKEIVFPNTLTEIGSRAFADCTSLKKVNIITANEEDLNIAYDAFVNSGLEELYIFNTGHLNIQDSVDFTCKIPNLKKIKITGTEYSKITIGKETFRNYDKLENINIVTKGSININTRAFEYCSVLEEINIIADKGINIGDEAFFNCKSLKRLNIQSTIEEIIKIENYAFKDCSLLNTVNIPSYSRVQMYDSSFTGCRSLKNINCKGSISLINDIPLSNYTAQEIANIIKHPEKINIDIKSKEEHQETQNIYEKDKNPEEELRRNEQVEKILEKLEEINESIKESSKDKGYPSTSLDNNTIESIVDGIWDIL